MPNVRTSYEYLIPNSIDEALNMMHTYGDDCKVIAGGTDIIPKIKAGVKPFKELISLRNLDDLRFIDFDENKGIRIGALMPLRRCEANEDICKYYPALYQGMHSMANTQVRNRGTIPGNISNAIPSADTAPPLLVYGAEIKAVSAEGERIIPITEFFAGVGKNNLRSDELITEIFIPIPDKNAHSIYYKYAIRKALDLAMVGVASCVTLDENDVVQKAKLALGAVAVIPKRAENTEKLIIGQKLTEELIEEAAQTAANLDCSPISDIRATALYRKKMVYVHVRDALRKAVENNEKNS